LRMINPDGGQRKRGASKKPKKTWPFHESEQQGEEKASTGQKKRRSKHSDRKKGGDFRPRRRNWKPLDVGTVEKIFEGKSKEKPRQKRSLQKRDWERGKPKSRNQNSALGELPRSVSGRGPLDSEVSGREKGGKKRKHKRHGWRSFRSRGGTEGAARNRSALDVRMSASPHLKNKMKGKEGRERLGMGGSGPYLEATSPGESH